MELAAGVDLGTSYFKVGLFDRDGSMRGLGRVAVIKDTGEGSLCEVSLERFWTLLKDAFQQALTQAGTTRGDIKAIGYSSQANSFILLDQNAAPLTPLILWPDNRAGQVDDALCALWQRPDFLHTTGLGMMCTPKFCAAKIKWFQKERPDIWQNVKRVMSISDYFTFALTGSAVGDAGTASLLGLFDLRHGRWWDEAFDILGLDKAYFSQPLMPGSVAGVVTDTGAKALGICPGAAVAVGSLDHHIAAVGAGIPALATVSESTGTVLACLNYAHTFSPKSGCCMGPGFESGSFYQLAFSSNGAGVLEWYQKNFAPQLSIPQLLELARGVAPWADGLTALPCADTYPDRKGFKGAKPQHTHGHYVRAILESTTATLGELVATLCGQDVPRRIVATGGGARSDLWLEIKAAAIKTEFVTTDCQEPACRGAAALAAKACGWFADLDACLKAWVRPAGVFTYRR